MRPDVQDLDQVTLLVKVIREEKEQRTDLEFHDSHASQRSDLRFAREGIPKDTPDGFICLELGGWG